MRAILWALFSISIGVARTVFALGSVGSQDEPALSRITNELCKAHIVFLGEPSHHGSARTIEYKAAIAKRLIDHCHFSTIIFESSLYDLLEYNRRIAKSEPVSLQMLLNDIGGMWSTVQEFQPFAKFLFERSKESRLRIEGIDDQLSATGEFVGGAMGSELAGYLSGQEGARCKEVLEKYLLWTYDKLHPYSVDDKERVLGCLKLIRGKEALGSTMMTLITTSLERLVSRDFLSKNEKKGLKNTRDYSMFLNFKSLMERLEPGNKVIVWAATIHLAKSPQSVRASKSDWHSFGTDVALGMSIKPVTIGFTSLGGYFGRTKALPLSNAPSDSLEARAFVGTNKTVVYESKARLMREGKIAARVFGNTFQSEDWGDILDGLVIFRSDESVKLLK